MSCGFGNIIRPCSVTGFSKSRISQTIFPHPAFSRVFASRLMSVSAFSVTRWRKDVTWFSAMSWLICLYSCPASALKLSRVNPLICWHWPSVRMSCTGLEIMRTSAFHPDVPRKDDSAGHGLGPRYGSAMTPGERRNARSPCERALLNSAGKVSPFGTPDALGVSFAIPRRVTRVVGAASSRERRRSAASPATLRWWRRAARPRPRARVGASARAIDDDAAVPDVSRDAAVEREPRARAWMLHRRAREAFEPAARVIRIGSPPRAAKLC